MDKKMFIPTAKKRSFDEIYSSIKELILEGSLKVGDRLPSESQLAEQFQVGRQTVREALRLLEQSGFISIRRGGGGGSVVEDMVLKKAGNQFVDALRMRDFTLEDLTAARVEIERVILTHAIDNADEDDLQRLKDNVAEANSYISNDEPATKLNAEFHKLLAIATKNEVFVVVVETLMTVHLNLLERINSDVETSRNVVKAHEKILEKMISGDRVMAKKLLEEHVLEVKSRLDNLSFNNEK